MSQPAPTHSPENQHEAVQLHHQPLPDDEQTPRCFDEEATPPNAADLRANELYGEIIYILLNRVTRAGFIFRMFTD